MSHGLWQARFATRDILLSFSFGLTHRIVMPIMAEHRWLYPTTGPSCRGLSGSTALKGAANIADARMAVMYFI